MKSKWTVLHKLLFLKSKLYKLYAASIATLLFPVVMRKIGTMGDMISSFCWIGVIGYIIVFFSNDNLIGVVLGGKIGSAVDSAVTGTLLGVVGYVKVNFYCSL